MTRASTTSASAQAVLKARALETIGSGIMSIGDEASSPAPRRHRFYSIPQLDDLPVQQWIIDNALPANALVGLIGPKGAFKTFVAVDLALHVAFGLEWHGRLTCARPVAYVYAEGPFGARDRVNAWLAYQQRRGLQIDRGHIPIKFLPSRVALNNPSEATRLELDIRGQFCADELPHLIIVDTLNRNLDGDEDGRGMTSYVAGCARLQESLGATILSVHHTPLGAEDRGRGHTAFDGAIDTRLIVARDEHRVTLECTHQRNGPDGWCAFYEVIPCAGSLVLQPSSPTGGDLEGKRRELLELLSERDTATYTALLTDSGMKLPTFKKALRWLSERKYVAKTDRRYRITDAGRDALRIPGIPQGSRG